MEPKTDINEYIQIHGFPKVNKKHLWKYLQNDIDDDWFQDSLRYSDYKELGKELEVISNNATANLGKYRPNQRDLFYVPKSNFTLRYSLETDFYDRWMYFYTTLPLMKKFDSLLRPIVYSHRYVGLEKYLFHNRIHQWEKFEGIVRSRSECNTILHTDIQNYYENISIDLLKADLEDCLKNTAGNLQEMKEKKESIDCLIACLTEWSYDKKRGLPQNRDCSSFLANIYMKSIDDAMCNADFDYYRYMDDIRVVCSDKFEARKAIKLLVNSLRDKFLSLNGKKTKIIEPDTEEHKEIITPSFELKRIDSLLNTKRKANVAIGYELLRDKFLKLIEKKDYDSREFRFCINRLSKLARCKDYHVPVKFWDGVTNGVIESIVDSPTSTDRAYEFLASVELSAIHIDTIQNYLLDDRLSIYEWQNYWLWKLLIVRKVDRDQIKSKAKNIISSENSPDPDKAGAILYLAQFGDLEDKRKIKNSYVANESSMLQRHKLLASKDLDWIRDDVQIIKPLISKRLEGTFRIMQSKVKNFVTPPPPTSIREILESVHQYD